MYGNRSCSLRIEEVVESLDETGTLVAALEGERKQVTVLFAGVKGRWIWPSKSIPKSGTRSWIASWRSCPKEFIGAMAPF
jgi:hypothetical protein